MARTTISPTPFSDDPNDMVFEYAPDAVRAAAFNFARKHNTKNVRWLVREDGNFDVAVTKRGGTMMSTVFDRNGNEIV